ncbi:MAG: gliding motility-associated ABC transporter substrate-binding protein GldG [Bacteroidetes bacterium]|nr:gliding motility-associated ABC transporter substrate-binding protein GldG [Bacteroidota bacterium]
MTAIRSHKQKALIQLALLLAILIFVNILSSGLYTRIDLTQEKRFTLAEPTKQMLAELEDMVYVKIYLEGEFPAGFKRLRNSAQEMLDEMRSYSNNKIDYEFIDPFEGVGAEEKQEIYNQLVQKGLEPTNLQVQGQEEYSERIIFPGALFNYRGKEIAVHLLHNQFGQGPQEALNTSVILLEYKFTKAIRNLTTSYKPQLAFTEGHGELLDEDIEDLARSLQEFYTMVRFDLSEEIAIPQEYSCLVIAKPTKKFNKQDKYKIDQFIMNGGKVLWLVEGVKADMDSLQNKNEFFTQINDLNLDDILFKYGVRVNFDLVQDLYCNPIPLVIGFQGDMPQSKLYPWYYFPVFTSRNDHPINKNLDVVSSQFCSTIDTVGAKKVKKTVLMATSDYTKVMPHPVKVHLGIMREEPDPSRFTKKSQPTAVLLEGIFESVFKNRLTPETMQMIDTVQKLPYLEQSVETKMVIIADGDIMKNERSSGGLGYPLGYYPFTEQTFANKDLLLNIFEYLVGDAGLMETRSKEITLRMLDTRKVKEEKFKWQLINIGVPLALVLIFGFIYNFIRKRKYAI